MGNRGGRIHTPETKTLGKRRWAGKQWIYCKLNFKNRQRDVMGQSYTELFFFDEASALAAGHRPCFECQRSRAQQFQETFSQALGLTHRLRAPEIDQQLHHERCKRENFRPLKAFDDALHNGIFIRQGAKVGVIQNEQFLPWAPSGYGPPIAINLETASVVTPPSIVEAIKKGFSAKILA